MQCREFEQRLNELLDERARPEADSRLSAHAARCPRCRQILAGQQMLLEGLSQLATPTLRRDFAQRVVAEVATRPAAPRVGRRWISLAACLASAAAMLLAVSLVWYARRTRPVLDRPFDTAHRSAALPRQNALAMVQSGGSQRPTAQRQRPALTGADLLLEAPRLPGHLLSYRAAIDDLGTTLPEAVERLDEVERLTPGIRPLRVSLYMIWDTLCRTIPGARVDSPPPNRGRTSLRWLEPVRLA